MGEMLDTHDRTTAPRSAAYRAKRRPGRRRAASSCCRRFSGSIHHIRSIADRFAAAGYLAVAPALFDRVEKGVELAYDGGGMGQRHGPHEEGRSGRGTRWHDVAAAVKAASAKPAPSASSASAGAARWPMPRRRSLDTASPRPSATTAAASPASIARPPALPRRCCTSAKQDSTHPDERRRQDPRTPIPAWPIYTYPAGHGFNCDVRGSFHDKPSADLAWSRTIELLRASTSSKPKDRP